jgi:hypothetical protein
MHTAAHGVVSTFRLYKPLTLWLGTRPHEQQYTTVHSIILPLHIIILVYTTCTSPLHITYRKALHVS